jgi:hypothetical protein
MLYMFPLGSGVSKAGIPDAPQGHHWSDEEHHFWCCQGSGIEAFARLADTIFWRRDGGSPPLLFVLQLLPSSLIWREAAIRVAVGGDYPGSSGAGVPLRVHVSFERLVSDGVSGGASGGEANRAGARGGGVSGGGVSGGGVSVGGVSGGGASGSGASGGGASGGDAALSAAAPAEDPAGSAVDVAAA